ncbi:MAG: putative capsular polysaccharide synthesis family protein [Bacteroidota bacterium]
MKLNFLRRIRQLLERYIYPAFFDWQWTTERPPVFVYQMGKVASSSVYHSLKKQHSGIILHAHTFSTNHPQWEIRRLYEHFKKGHPIKIITLVREPISRNISDFFQNFHLFTKQEFRSTFEEGGMSIAQLRKLFLLYYYHSMPLTWFDNNLKKHFAIDVYHHPFPKEQGFLQITTAKIDLLILRYDLVNSQKEQLIKAFLLLPKFELVDRNISQEKNYSIIYQRFLEEVKLPDFVLNTIKESTYFNHFYSKKEIDQTIARWQL